MAKYLFLGNYVGDGVAGLRRDGGTKRRDAVERLAASVGGTVESLYYAFGDTDVYVIFDVPDHVAAASLSLAVNASGAVAGSMTVLLTAEDMDAATKLSPEYHAPGT